MAEVDKKTTKRSLGMVFMLARDYHLGSTQLIPEATEVHFKVAEVDQKNNQAQLGIMLARDRDQRIPEATASLQLFLVSTQLILKAHINLDHNSENSVWEVPIVGNQY